MKSGYRIALGILISLLTSAMLILAFHPNNIWYLAFFALVPMLIAQYRLLPIKWAGLASAIGIGGWLFVFLTAMFGNNPAARVIQIVVLVIVVIQIFTAPGLRRFHEKSAYRWFVLQGVVDWVGLEMVRSFIPPINTHAFISQTMYTQPCLMQPISIFSLYGLSMLIILTNFALAQTFLLLFDKYWHLEDFPTFKPGSVFRWLAVAGVALVVWIAIGSLLLNARFEKTPSIRVAAIQHNFPVPGHQDTPESQLARLEELSKQTRLAASQGAQLAVWPELGLGFDPQVEHRAELEALAAETNLYIFIGYGLDDPRGWRNEMVLLTPAGEFLQVYGKNHPTSPGEPRIITSGVYPVYQTPLGNLATIICNDVHFTDTARTLASMGAQLVAVPTLEIAGIAIEQVAQSVFRAVENRVAVVKTDVAYAAAIIDPFGRIVAYQNGSPDGQAFALVADVQLGTPSTFYTRNGDWLGWFNLAGFVFFIVFQMAVERKKRTGK